MASTPLGILDLIPIPSGSAAAQALRNRIDLARHAVLAGEWAGGERRRRGRQPQATFPYLPGRAPRGRETGRPAA